MSLRNGRSKQACFQGENRGSGIAAWVREQILSARRAIAKRGTPLEFIGIYQASSEEGDLGLLVPYLRIIDGRRGVAESQLGDVLKNR